MTNAIFLAYVITTCEREQYQCETATNEKDDAVCIWHTSYRYVMWVCLLVSLSFFLSFFLSLFFVPYFGSYFRICHAWNSTICCKVGVNNLLPSRAPPWGPTICTYICITGINLFGYISWRSHKYYCSRWGKQQGTLSPHSRWNVKGIMVVHLLGMIVCDY